MRPEDAIRPLKELSDRKKMADQCDQASASDIRLYYALDTAIAALKKQIPKKPYQDNENGVHEKDYCPTCHRSLFPYDHHCRCGQAIDWTDWEK